MIKKIKTGYNTQYSQWRGLWEFEAFCPASRFVTVDKDVARKPPLAILPTLPTRRRKTQQQCNDRIKWFENEKRNDNDRKKI